jgi:hypothetical protein
MTTNVGEWARGALVGQLDELTGELDRIRQHGDDLRSIVLELGELLDQSAGDGIAHRLRLVRQTALQGIVAERGTQKAAAEYLGLSEQVVGRLLRPVRSRGKGGD